MSTPLSTNQLIRYSRQLRLPQIGLAGQQKLQASRVLIIGAGGLGAPAAMYLAALGIGELTLADGDVVELSNLHRQLLHGTPDIGRAKVESARDTLHRLNPEIILHTLPKRLEGAALLAAVQQVDLVVDSCDNFATRFAVNAACVTARKPLISGAAVRMEGQISVFRLDLPDSPCYRCLYRDGSDQAETCDANGVLPPVVGVIGSMQALEAVKVLLGIGESLHGRLLLFDALRAEWRTLKLKRDPDCPICAKKSA